MKDASKWLEEHHDELDSEEITSEEEKQLYAFQVSWPTLRPLPDLGTFSQITTSEDFNRVIGDPANWQTIRNSSGLLNGWVIPNAILLFGKTWFDKAKWSSSIVGGGKFPLFSHSDKAYSKKRGVALEQTPMGKAKISQIIAKVAYSLNVYLKGEWYNGSIKPPSGYITESIKHEMIRSIANDNGYKLTHAPACPFCLGRGRKTVVQRHSNTEVSCDICQELYDNIKLNVNKCVQEGKFDGATELYSKLLSSERFLNFSPLTTVCPSCEKHTPVSCLDYNYSDEHVSSINSELLKIRIPKTTQTNIGVPPSLKHMKLYCPHCTHRFKPKFFTGLPSIGIWQMPAKSLDEPNANGVELKNMLADSSMNAVQEQINNQQRLKVLIDELVIKLSTTTRGSVFSLTTWYFYLAAIIWMKNYPNDAASYLFDFESGERTLTRKELRHSRNTTKKTTNVSLGKEVSVHQAIFYIWVDLLDENIDEFRRLDSSFVGLSSFPWLANVPKFSDGPMSTFTSAVTLDGITNGSSVYEVGSSAKPRIAKVIAIYKIEDGEVDPYNFVEDIKSLEWQNIRLEPNTRLSIGDKVCVSVLLMSGHPTHAPIQRILRLRKSVLQPIVNKVLLEEKGHTFQDFWLRRNKLVKEAYQKLGSLNELGEKYGR